MRFKWNLTNITKSQRKNEEKKGGDEVVYFVFLCKERIHIWNKGTVVTWWINPLDVNV